MKKMFLRFGAVALAFFMTACGNTEVGTGGQSSASNTTDATVYQNWYQSVYEPSYTQGH